jgi:DNA-binding beta-propeller fold protein YncE
MNEMRQLGGNGMRGWARRLSLILVTGILAVGCGSKNTAGVSVTVSPATATVLINTNAQFSATASNGGAVNWAVNNIPGGNVTFGTIDSMGFYTAPSALPVPANTAITVTATLQSNSSISGSAVVTLDSGVRVTINPGSVTMSAGESFTFSATVSGVSASASTATCAPPPSALPVCTAVTWSLNPATGAGTIGATTGLYTSPTQTSATVIATSVFDSTRTGDASVLVFTATPPTLTSISPTTAARGALFQDVYLTGTNFLSTTTVSVNGTQVPTTNTIVPSPGLTTTVQPTTGALIHVRLPDTFLTAAPSGTNTAAALTFTVAPQSGTQVACSPNPAPCQLSLVPVRPAAVGTSPDSIPQGSASAPLSFNLNGGFFGPPNQRVVTAQFAGHSAPPVDTAGSVDRQLSVPLGAADVNTPGLFPVAVLSNSPTSGVPPVVANLAIQPAYPPSTHPLLAQPAVGSAPAAVAINTATGIAVVANQGSSDVTLIDLTQSPPAVKGFICTGVQGASLTVTESLSPACSAAGPVSVAVDNILNIALVANQGSNSIAVVDLAQQKVTAVVPAPTNNSLTPPGPFIPVGVGINSVTHRAIVAYRSTNVASILDLTQSPQSPLFFVGVVNISNGPNARVSVSSRLNWALVTPGGLGTLSIVDLGRQSTNAIVAGTGASRAAGTVTITTSTSHALLVGEPVLISGVADASFDGVYDVVSVPSSTTFTYTQSASLASATSGGGSAAYALPVATLATIASIQSVALNDETQKAILVDPSGTTPGTILNVLDQTSTTIPLPMADQQDAQGNVGAAFNPLANLAVTVNEITGDALVIDPNAPSVLTTFNVGGVRPVDVAIDPVTDIAVFVNQGSGTASIFSLGQLRPLHVLQASVTTPGGPSLPIVSGPSVLINSTLSTPAVASSQTLTLIGNGFTVNSQARLDGVALATTFVSPRELTATVSPSFQSAPRRYALDVADSGVVSNASSFTVVESVNVGVGNGNSNCSVPVPQGVAIDPQLNLAVVTDSGPGCNQIYLINLATGTGQTVAVGTDPQGVAVYPQLGVAVVANQGSSTASVVDETVPSVAATVTTDAGPVGVAIDQDLGEAIVTASGANVADEFLISVRGTRPISPSPTTPITIQQGPGAVAADSLSHLAAIGNATSNNVTVVNLSQMANLNTTSTIQIPQGVAVDPVPSPANFLITASLQNQVEILDPDTGVLTPLRVGINPTALAYNFATSTLVTLNTLSQTMTVIDFLERRVRAVFPVAPSSQFSVDIHPQTNLAVVADSINSRVLLLPLPR